MRPSRTLLLFFFLFSAVSHALVTPLPGASGQSTRLSAAFANPVGVRVVDSAGNLVVNELVAIYTPLYAPSIIGGMFPDLLQWHSSAVTDNAGIAVMRMPYGKAPGTATLTFNAGRHGKADIQLRVEDSLPPAQLVIVAGDGQTASEGSELPQPFAVQTLDSAGVPIPLAIVSFYAVGPVGRYPAAGATGTFDGSTFTQVVADARGIATSPPFTTAMVNSILLSPTGTIVRSGSGVGYLRAQTEWVHSQGSTFFSALFRFDVQLLGASAPTPQDMWWGGPSQNGWGLSVVEHGRGKSPFDPELFVVLFIYDAQGKPTWYVASQGFWDSGYGTTWHGNIYKPKGTPFFAYDARSLKVGPAVGELYLRFIGSGRLRLEYDLREYPNNVGRGIKELVRQDFTGDAPSPRQGLGDMWWGGIEQNGWGMALMEQVGNLFGVWFTYDATGAPTWFFMPGGSWANPTTYVGDLYRSRGSRWIGVPYDASALRLEPLGRLHIDAAASSGLRVDYEAEAHRGILLQRQPFATYE